MTAVVEPAAGAFGSQPVMLPVIEAKRKFAPHGALAQGPGRTNSVETGLATSASAWVEKGYLVAYIGRAGYSDAAGDGVLLATQKGLLAVSEMPHGLTSSGSRTGARPGTSEMRLVWR